MYNGILIFNKPQGFTSHDVVAKLRGVLRQKRIGHAGTLDPMATGVLAVLLGSATKASEDAASHQKAYIAGIRLGMVTDTLDIWGTVLSQSADFVEKKRLEHALEGFRGRILQKPPMYSAVKLGGQKLYTLARRGVEVEAPAREIFVHKLEVLQQAAPMAGRPDEPRDFLLEIECSKGTYVRSLCHDIGQAVGCGACMSSLVRTRSGSFELPDALGFEEVERLHAEGGLAGKLMQVECIYSSLEAVKLSDEGAARAKNGALILCRHLAEGRMPENEGERVRIYVQDKFIMLGEARRVDGQMALACKKNFAAASGTQ